MCRVSPRTVLSQDRGAITAALRGHGLDVLTVTEMLGFAALHGDAQTVYALVTFDGGTWTADLFMSPREAA